MRTRLGLLLVVVLGLLTPHHASADPYVVHLGKRVESKSAEALLAPFRTLSLELRYEVRILPGTVIVEMPPSTAEVMKEQGYEVEYLPPLHLLGDVPWSLDRDNQRALPLDGNIFRPYAGVKVRLFILDTGIFRNPDEFGDRLTAADYIKDGQGPFAACGDNATHATAVASMAAGNVYGVAPGVSISLMRVIGCNDTVWFAALFAAVDDIAAWKKAHPTEPAIVNMSFGGKGNFTTMHAALKVLDKLGVILIDGGGNDNRDSCLSSPAGFPETITAGASTKDDHRASWSAWGTCIDLFAPGDSVPQRSGEGTQEWFGSGTSLSSPATAGEIALMLEQIPDLTSAEARKLLLANATGGALQGDLGKGSPNRILYIGPIKEEVSKLSFQWLSSKHQFTVQVGLSLNGKPTPLSPIRLYRGAAVSGSCQGQSFATVPLVNGSGTATITGFKQAPGAVCLQSRSGLVYSRKVGNS